MSELDAQDISSTCCCCWSIKWDAVLIPFLGDFLDLSNREETPGVGPWRRRRNYISYLPKNDLGPPPKEEQWRALCAL